MKLKNHRPLGDILLELNLLTADDLADVRAEQGRTGERLGDVLLKKKLVGEEDLMRALSLQSGIPLEPLTDVKIARDVIESVPARLVNLYEVVPLAREEGVLKLGMTDPLDINALDELSLYLHTTIAPVFATSKDIKDAIKRYYGVGADTMEGMVEDDDEEFKPVAVENIEDLAEDASIVRFVNQIILEAIDDRATDIHFEPLEEELRIRYRIDGLLYEVTVPSTIARYQAAIISRLKIMADLNIAERRLPQDGKIKIRKGDKDFDLRVSTIPTPYGESVVMRILSRDSEFVTLEKLGFDEHTAALLRSMIHQPHGIVLVTGPTGSGKSTTLYAALNEINTLDKKIMSIEDPIEYRINGVMQVQINSSISLTFSRCLRTFLRQDPDVIMVGETRDQETAQITIQTALTGHLVFSTLHTNDACSAVTRLLDMGIEPFLISSSVIGLLAQRLVRKLCPHCKQAYEPDPVQLKRVNVTGDDPATLKLYRQRGCEKCRYTGFSGRMAIYELAQITEEFRQLIVARATANELKAAAMRAGLRPLRQDGWIKCKQGHTTIEEVLRVTLEDEIMSAEEIDELARASHTKALAAPGVEAQAAQLPAVDSSASSPRPEITRTFELES